MTAACCLLLTPLSPIFHAHPTGLFGMCCTPRVARSLLLCVSFLEGVGVAPSFLPSVLFCFLLAFALDESRSDVVLRCVEFGWWYCVCATFAAKATIRPLYFFTPRASSGLLHTPHAAPHEHRCRWLHRDANQYLPNPTCPLQPWVVHELRVATPAWPPPALVG